MNKEEFLARLRDALAGLPQEDVDERLTFYDEMIDDRVEDGLSEEAAVAGIGPVEEIVSQIVSDIPLPRLVRERIKPKRRFQAWQLVLLILGFPLWFPLLIAAFAVLLSVYIVIWVVIVSLWAVEVSFAVSALGGIAAGLLLGLPAGVPKGLVMIGAGIVLAGLSIFLFFGCKAVTGGAVRLTKKIAPGIKSLFLRKENAG
jgi:uncharacterized membrane protein